MNKQTSLSLIAALIVSACAGASDSAMLGGPGEAYVATNEGVLQTTAEPMTFDDGKSGWRVSCNVGRNYESCESRLRSLCPKGFKTVSREAKPARNAPGMLMDTRRGASVGAGIDVRTIPTAVNRTMTAKCDP